MVQEFLSAVEDEVEEEITEDMSADQLMEKLERLEMLQQAQSSREGEVKAIDSSADSEEVKEALKKNPDISKERNNLLQGLYNYSCMLSVYRLYTHFERLYHMYLLRGKVSNVS